MKQFFLAIYLLLIISGCSDTGECESSLVSSINVEENKNGPIIAKPSEDDIAQTLKSYYISGVAIDGYVSGATVKVGGKIVQTDEKGNWFLEYTEDDNLSIGEVSISGGIDTSTGKPYEGELKVFIEKKDIGIDKNSSTSVPATPLTTLVSAMIINGDSKEKAEIYLAKSLGLSPNIFRQDPIHTLKNGTQEEKLESAQAIKKSLIIQKMAESLAKTITGDSNNSRDKLSAFDSVISAVATQIADGNSSFDSIMKDTDSIAEITAQKIETKVQNNDFDIDINLSQTTTKLKAVGEISQSITMMFNLIDENELANGDSNSTDLLLESTSKACEIATLKVEQKIEKIRNLKMHEIEEWVKDTKKVTNSLIMMGGIESLSNKVEIAILEKQQKSIISNDINSSEIDVLDFSEFISDNLIEEQNKIYEKFADLNISPEQILEAVLIKENSNDETSLTEAFKEMADKDDDFEVDDFETHFQEIELDIDKADKHLEIALNDNIENPDEIPKEIEKEIEDDNKDIIDKEEEKDDEVIIQPNPVNPDIPQTVDYDYLKFVKVEFGLDKLEPKIEKNIDSGFFETIIFQNLGGKALSEYGTNIDKHLFLTEIELKNIDFENEEKLVSLIFKVQSQVNSEKFLAIFQNISLKQENGVFSADLDNLKCKTYITYENETETSSEINDSKHYLKISDNEIEISVSELFPAKFIKNGKFDFFIGLSGDFTGIENSTSFQTKEFQNEIYGIRGVFEIVEANLSQNAEAPPLPPTLNLGL